MLSAHPFWLTWMKLVILIEWSSYHDFAVGVDAYVLVATSHEHVSHGDAPLPTKQWLCWRGTSLELILPSSMHSLPWMHSFSWRYLRYLVQVAVCTAFFLLSGSCTSFLWEPCWAQAPHFIWHYLHFYGSIWLVRNLSLVHLDALNYA